MTATVLLPASLGALHEERLLLAVADGAHAVPGDAQGDEVLLDGGGTAIAETQVVFRGAALVAMTFDGYFDLRIVLQEFRGLGERDACVGLGVGVFTVTLAEALALPPGPDAVIV